MRLDETYRLFWEDLKQGLAYCEVADMACIKAEEKMAYTKEHSLYLFFENRLIGWYGIEDAKIEQEKGFSFYSQAKNVDWIIEEKMAAAQKSDEYLRLMNGTDLHKMSIGNLEQHLDALLDLYKNGLSVHMFTQPQFFETFEELHDAQYDNMLERLAKARFEYSKPSWVRPLEVSRPVFAEYARRLEILAEEAENMTKVERDTGVYDRRTLQARAKQYVLISEKHEQSIYAGKESQEYIDAYHEYLSRYEQSMGKGVARGIIGNKGVVRAPAFVFGSDHFDPKSPPQGMQKGMVLIVQNAWPDLQPFFELASAIVTNEGGITSHGVVVARELKIPCIVGTKIGTKTFKTGDTVEVDADNGVVRKI